MLMKADRGYIQRFTEEYTMSKEQRNEKLTKKPKKNSAPAKDTSSSTSTRPMAPVTAVPAKGKMKDK
jgi:hypothetical protein